MIWRVRPDLAALNVYVRRNMGAHLDINVIEMGDDFMRASMPVDERTKQPMGFLHGGASAVLAETIASVASYYCLRDADKYGIVGSELNISHLRAVQSGKVYAKTKPIKLGRRSHIWGIRITDDRNKLIAISRLTTMVIEQ